MMKKYKSIHKAFVLTSLIMLTVFTGCQKANQTAEQTDQTITRPQVLARNWDESTAYYQNVAVRHNVLYLDGSYETNGGDKIYDKFSTEDLHAFVICPSQHLMGIATLPFNLCFHPPWNTEYSRSIYPMEPVAFEPPVLHLELSPHEPH